MDEELNYSTSNLTYAINDLRGSEHAISEMVFDRELTFDTESIRIDREIHARRLAPWSGPMTRGVRVSPRGFKTESLAPGYQKFVTPLDKNRPFHRAYGEQLLGGGYSPAQRAMMQLREVLMDHEGMLMDRCEWMCAHTLVHGGYGIATRDHGDIVIDFGRPASQDIVLARDELWSDPQSNPNTNLTKWAELMAVNGGGMGTMVIMGTDAFIAFREHPKVEKKFDWASNRMNMSDLDIGAQFTFGLKYRGHYDGFEIYTHVDTYISDGVEFARAAGGGIERVNTYVPFLGGAEQPIVEGAQLRFIPSTSLLMLNPMVLRGTKGYGAIRDEFFVNMPYMPKATRSWVDDELGQRFVLTQSAPLVWPLKIEASLHAKVA